MDHLFNSVVKAEQSAIVQVDGVRDTRWVPAGNDPAEVALLAYIRCRLDLNFVRPGKDAPPAQQAGQAPERVGVMFVGAQYQGILRSGMRLVVIDNAVGQQPVQGIFDIRAIPDVAVDYSSAHHIEVQVFEILQPDLDMEWPTSDGGYEVEEVTP